jgi:Family of unknown function (DUF6011)
MKDALSRTRAKRVERLAHDVAQLVASGQPTGPADRCFVCNRPLSDQQSLARGIGSDCFKAVQAEIARLVGAAP